MPKMEDEEEDTWSQIKKAVAPYLDPAVAAREEQIKQFGYGETPYEQEMKNLTNEERARRFQKGMFGK